MTRVEPVIYRHTADAFFKQVLARKGLLTPEFLATLAALGIDPKKPRDVDVATWWKVIEAAARVIAPGQPLDEALREVGREVLRGFEASLVGRTAMMVLRMLGHRRAVTKLAESFKSADNVTTVEVLETTPTRARVRYTVVGGLRFPTYSEGVLVEGLERLGAKSPRVEHAVEPGGAVVYVMTWAA